MRGLARIVSLNCWLQGYEFGVCKGLAGLKGTVGPGVLPTGCCSSSGRFVGLLYPICPSISVCVCVSVSLARGFVRVIW